MLPSACGKDLTRFSRRRSNSEYLGTSLAGVGPVVMTRTKSGLGVEVLWWSQALCNVYNPGDTKVQAIATHRTRPVQCYITAKFEHIPFPNVHIATLEGAYSQVPDDIRADARSPRNNGIIIDSHRPSPATLALLVLLLGMVLELYRTRAEVSDGVIRCSAAVTRTPKGRCFCLAVCMMSGGGNGVCRCLHGRLPVGGWVRVVKMQHLLFRAVRRRWSALLLWRLPHRL